MTLLSNLGFGLLILTLLVSLYGIVAAIIGLRKNSLVWAESARLAMLLTFPLLTLVSLSLIVRWSAGITR